MKKSHFLVILLLLSLILPVKVDAADLKLTYKEKTSISYVKSKHDEQYIFPSYDNYGKMDGILVLSMSEEHASDDILLEKYSLAGKLLYKKNAKEFYSDFTVTGDYISSDNQSEYVVKGESDALISVTNNNTGEEVFKRQYGGSGNEEGGFGFKSYDNNGIHDGYIAFVLSFSTDLGIDPGFIMLKYDLKGNLIWQKNINDSNIPGLFYIVDGKLDSSISWGCGDQVEFQRYSIINEKVLWEANSKLVCSGLVFDMNFSYDKTGVIDGVIIAGFTVNESGKRIGNLLKYDLNGNEVFRYEYDQPSMYTGVISSKNIDGTYDGYIVAGISDAGTIILKYDYSGKIVWKDVYSSNELIKFKILQNYDANQKFNGYLLYGYSYNFSAYRKNDDNLNYYPTFRKLSIKKVDVESDNKIVIAKYTYEMFDVKKETSDEGTISVDEKAYPGDIVKVKVTPKKGYVLKRIVVMDESGKEIEVTDDGTFIMPEGKVTVTAIYNKITNPETVSACYIVLGIILLISVGTLIVNRQKAVKNN